MIKVTIAFPNTLIKSVFSPCQMMTLDESHFVKSHQDSNTFPTNATIL